MIKAVSEGKEFLGLRTKQRLVTYIDYENPLPMLVERVRKLNIDLPASGTSRAIPAHPNSTATIGSCSRA